jgi:hypothetical protein
MAKAAKAFHAYDEEAGRYKAYKPGENVPDHVALRVSPENLSGKLPERPEDSDPVVELRQSEIDDLVAQLAGEKQFSQEDLDKAVEDARAALIADLEQLAADAPKPEDGDGAVTTGAIEAKDVTTGTVGGPKPPDPEKPADAKKPGGK